MVQGKYDGADHGDEQDEAGRLEQIDIFRVEDLAERRGVAEAGRRGGLRLALGRRHPSAEDEEKLDEEEDADGGANGQIFEEAGPQLGEVDVQHHHHE